MLLREYYVNPLQDFVVGQIRQNDFVAQNVTLAKLLSKPFKDNSIESKCI